MDAGYLRRSGGWRGSVLDRARWPGHSRTLLPRVPSTARASVDRVHRNLERIARPRYCARIEVRDDGTGDRAWLQAGGTANDGANAPILHINQEMGYRVVTPVIELHRNLRA